MATLTISLDSKQVEKKLDTLGKSIKSYKQPLTEIGEELIDYYGDKVFASQGKENGAQWKPLSASTLLAREMRTGHYAKTPIATDKILIWTGAMKKGFKKTVTATKLTIFNTIAYFKHNQPNRPMLSINKKVIDLVMQSLTQYIQKAIK